MEAYRLTNAQARRFLLRYQGLLGEPIFAGKAGVTAYTKRAGCIQYDPIDVCGKNSELVYQSRVKGFTKAMLYELLYEERDLVDYFDKNLSIFPVADWPAFQRAREQHTLSGRSREEVERAAQTVREMLKSREWVTARDVGLDEKVSWYWSDTRLSRAVLETLYFRGELCIHHKQGTQKAYAPAERLLPREILTAPDPNSTEEDYRDFITLRRIGAVGLLWNRASDAFLCAPGHKDGGRQAAFANLLAQGKIIPVAVEGLRDTLYAPATALPLMEEVCSCTAYKPRMEVLAPLDGFLWDRKLMEALFGFSYRWEIYTPADKRQYGYYVLPLLHGEGFGGRVEAIAHRKESLLEVKNIWWEGKKAQGHFKKCMERLAAFNGCDGIRYPHGMA